MDFAKLTLLVLIGSIVLNVIAIGLEANVADVVALLRRPVLLLRSILAINVIMPIVAVALAFTFPLHPAVKIALVALSLSPIPPILPKKQRKVGGDSGYIHGLLVTVGLLAIVFIPFALEWVGRVFEVSLDLAPARVAKTVLITTLAPLGVGLLINQLAPAFAARIARPLALFATVTLLSGAVALIANVWPAMVSLVGNGTLAAFAVFVIVGLAVGHLLGGPQSEDRGVLALASSSRHPGIAMARANPVTPMAPMGTKPYSILCPER